MQRTNEVSSLNFVCRPLAIAAAAVPDMDGIPKEKACGFGPGGAVTTDHENAARIDSFDSGSFMRGNLSGSSRSAADSLFDFLTRTVMHMQPRNHAMSAIDAQHGIFRMHSPWHLRRWVLAIAMPASLALMAGPVAAQLVTSSGDVFPQFTPGPVVDLTGQRIFVGNTINSTGTLGVTGGGVLTAAGIAAGNAGQATGIVTVSGVGSIVNLTGGSQFGGLLAGDSGIGSILISSGAQVVCSSPLACTGSAIGNAAGSTGNLTIDGAFVRGLGSITVGGGNLFPGQGTAGADTFATLSLNSGGSLATTGYSSVASNFGQTGLVNGNGTIDGAGSNWTITRDLASGGGQAFLSIATASNTTADVTISKGGRLSVTGSRSNPATDSSLPGFNMSTAAGATSTMTVESGGSVRIGGDTGIITLGGNSSTSSTGAKATLNIKSGGTVSGAAGFSNGLTFMAIGQNLGEGIVNVEGAGSQLTVAGVGGQNTQGLDGVGGLIIVGRNRNNGGGGIGTLNVTGGGSVLISDNGQVASTGLMGLRLADGAASSGEVNVSGPGSAIVIASTGGSATTPSVLIGRGGVGKMTVEDGGTVSVQGIGQRSVIVGGSSTGSGTLDLKTGAQINASWFAVGNAGGSGTATINNAAVNLDGVVFFNGESFGAGARVGRGVGSVGELNLENGAALNINNSIANAGVVLGGTNALPGGTGTLNMSGGSTINFTGPAASASLQVGGSSGGTGLMSMAGRSSVNAGATGVATVGGPAGSIGTLAMNSGSSLRADNINIGGNTDSLGAAGGKGTVTVSGLGSELRASGSSGFIGVGRGGNGTLEVTDQGKVSAIVMSVGRNSGLGNLNASNATIELSGQQTNNSQGAALGIGVGGGIGVATLTNTAVTVTNPGSAGAEVNVGGGSVFPGGNGTLTMTNSQITVNAAPGQGSVNIGRSGTGVATLSASASTINNSNGNVFVAREVGSTGILILSSGSVINAGFVGVGVSAPGSGNALGAAGGTGTLVLNDSTINTSRFELGAGSLLTGNNGTIDAGFDGPVVIGGTISPGNSPGRIRIKCDVTMLAGSKLILEISDTDGRPGVDFDIDQLIIGDDSKFDLASLQIIFSFIGSTNPNSFAASPGGFSLDKFLLASAPDDTILGGLSLLFGNARNPDTLNWGQAVNSQLFAFESSVYDVSARGFNPETGQIDITASARVPEPASIALVLLALAAMAMARRRHAAVRR